MSNGNFTGTTINSQRSDPELIQGLQTILPVISNQKVTLGMSAQQVTDLTNLCNAFITSYTNATSAKLAAKSAVSTKDAQKKAAMASLVSWIKQWRANPNVPDSLLEQLMVAPHKTPGTKTPPVTPTDLQAIPDGQGLVKLTWHRSTNISGTSYLIEARHSANDTWEGVGLTTKTKFVYQATPGAYIAFRIVAQRNNQQAPATPPVILWENGGAGAPDLQIAA